MQKKFSLLASSFFIAFNCLTASDLQAAFACGDVNGREAVNISDAVYLINHIFASRPLPCAACKYSVFGDLKVIKVLMAQPPLYFARNSGIFAEFPYSGQWDGLDDRTREARQ